MEGESVSMGGAEEEEEEEEEEDMEVEDEEEEDDEPVRVPDIVSESVCDAVFLLYRVHAWGVLCQIAHQCVLVNAVLHFLCVFTWSG